MSYDLQINQNAEQTYHSIRNYIVSAQHQLSAAVNSAMVITYWEIGEQIYKACGENDWAEYGKKLLQYLSEHLTAEFGKGFSVQGLRKNLQSPLGVSGSWNGRLTRCTISDSYVMEFLQIQPDTPTAEIGNSNLSAKCSISP